MRNNLDREKENLYKNISSGINWAKGFSVVGVILFILMFSFIILNTMSMHKEFDKRSENWDKSRQETLKRWEDKQKAWDQKFNDKKEEFKQNRNF